MGILSEKQLQIERQKLDAIVRYPRLWSTMITEWEAEGAEDRAWLVYSANYLLRTAGIRWAIDPVQLKHRLSAAAGVDVVRDLSRLSLIVLTHRHQDHLDLNLLHALRDANVRWIVPDDLVSTVVEQAGIPLEKVIVPRLHLPIGLGGLVLTSFEGLHWEKAASGVDAPARGVAATAYLAEFNGKRWLFLGDVRTYDPGLLPCFENLDGVFAHLWLGRSQALADDLPLVDAFCRFYLYLNPRQIVVAHLQEFGRTASDFWDSEHFQQVSARFQTLAPHVPVRVAFMGESVNL